MKSNKVLSLDEIKNALKAKQEQDNKKTLDMKKEYDNYISNLNALHIAAIDDVNKIINRSLFKMVESKSQQLVFGVGQLNTATMFAIVRQKIAANMKNLNIKNPIICVYIEVILMKYLNDSGHKVVFSHYINDDSNKPCLAVFDYSM